VRYYLNALSTGYVCLGSELIFDVVEGCWVPLVNNYIGEFLMATDYDLCWPTKYRYDILTPVAGSINSIISTVLDKLDASLLEPVRVRGDGVHIRVRIEDNQSVHEVLKYMRGCLSSCLMMENNDIMMACHCKNIFGKAYAKKTGNPGAASMDMFLDSLPQHSM